MKNETKKDALEETKSNKNETSESTKAQTEKETKEAPKEEIQEVEEKSDVIDLKRLDASFAEEVLSIPSGRSDRLGKNNAYRMVTFIIIWAKRNGITYEMDDYGNIYLTKGVLDSEEEAYPCVTAHMDTVQERQDNYARAGVRLNMKTTVEKNGKHKIFVEGFGLGGDDKAGIVLCLSMFKYFDKLKACFFLDEEVGCLGSKELNVDWFNNVGYVIGYDSPDLNRAAYSCGGIKLMNREFFENNGLDVICAKHGLNDFRSEPITDVMEIRKQTGVMCMNFGTGYYSCHTNQEYCILEDMDSALDMGVDIIEKLGNTRHIMPHVGTAYGYNKDETYFEKLNPNYKEPVSYKSTSTPYQYNNTYTKPQTTSSNTTTKTVENGKEVNIEVIKYVTERYDEYVLLLQNQVEEACKENGVNFNIFKDIFEKKIVF